MTRSNILEGEARPLERIARYPDTRDPADTRDPKEPGNRESGIRVSKQYGKPNRSSGCVSHK
jgi:hypothetical protein